MAEKTKISTQNIQVRIKNANQNSITKCSIVEIYDNNNCIYDNFLSFKPQETQEDIVAFVPSEQQNVNFIQPNQNNFVKVNFYENIDHRIKISPKFIAIDPNYNGEIILDFDENYNLTNSSKGAIEPKLLNINLNNDVRLGFDISTQEYIYANNFWVDNALHFKTLHDIPINPFKNEHKIRCTYLDTKNNQTYSQERTFKLTVQDNSPKVDLTFENDKFTSENATVSEVTTLEFECKLENVNAFMLDGKPYLINSDESKNLKFELNKIYKIKFGYFDEDEGKFFNPEEQVICKFSFNYSREITLTVDSDGECNFHNGNIYFDNVSKQQKIVHNKRDVIAELCGGGAAGAGALSFCIAIIFGLNPIAAAIIIPILALICFGLFIHGAIKNSKIYTLPKENESQEPETENFNNELTSTVNFDDPFNSQDSMPLIDEEEEEDLGEI